MLVKRLRTICDVEELSTENKHLSVLVETAEGDLRSCLNTLQVRLLPLSSPLPHPRLTLLRPIQFIKRNGSLVDVKAIQSATLGSKDTGTSASQVLDRLFKKPPRKRGQPAEGGIGVDERFVNRIVKDVQTSGEYEKISQGALSSPFPSFPHCRLTPRLPCFAGCFENYLVARGTNAESFPRIDKALEWLFLYDRLDSRLRSEREYELLAYVPYSFAPWYSLFSSQVPKEVERSKTDYEVR
jgi:chromosome transmission fidelity protein 18